MEYYRYPTDEISGRAELLLEYLDYLRRTWCSRYFFKNTNGDIISSLRREIRIPADYVPDKFFERKIPHKKIGDTIVFELEKLSLEIFIFEINDKIERKAYGMEIVQWIKKRPEDTDILLPLIPVYFSKVPSIRLLHGCAVSYGYLDGLFIFNKHENFNTSRKCRCTPFSSDLIIKFDPKNKSMQDLVEYPSETPNMTACKAALVANYAIKISLPPELLPLNWLPKHLDQQILALELAKLDPELGRKIVRALNEKDVHHIIFQDSVKLSNFPYITSAIKSIIGVTIEPV
jgi:hypothetical protein